MNKPLVSIIIPTFNRAHLIGETLDSIIAQTYTHWECIVVDDGSTDNTEVIVSGYIKKDSRFQFHHRPSTKVKGANSCRNFGASTAAGKYLIFLDSDDYLMNFCLKQRLEIVMQLNDFAFAVFPMLMKTSDGQILEKKIPKKESYIDEFLSDRLHWGIMCPIWNTNCFLDLNGFSESYPRLNDPDLHIRAMLYYPDKYFVFNNAEPDSVYVRADNLNSILFSEKVYYSLVLFIPDIVNHLVLTSNKAKLPLLNGYLLMWFTSFMKYSSYKQSKNVVLLFYQNNVITEIHKKIILINIFLYFSILKVSELFRKFVFKRII